MARPKIPKAEEPTIQNTLCHIIKLAGPTIKSVAWKIQDANAVRFRYHPGGNGESYDCTAEYDSTAKALRVTPDNHAAMGSMTQNFLPDLNAALTQMELSWSGPVDAGGRRKSHYKWGVDLSGYNPR